MKAMRVCVDTSVFCGVYDIEFKQPSLTFFEQVKSWQFALVAQAPSALTKSNPTWRAH